MWATFRTTLKIKKGGKELTKEACRSLNVNEEYLCALRTKSYVDFFSKAQCLLVNETPLSSSSSSSSSYFQHNLSSILLEPGQETITKILESAILSKKSDLKALILNYFDISAEASNICSLLLKSIHQVQSNYKFIHQLLDSIGEDHYSHDQFGLIVSDLHSFIILGNNNPFSNLKKQDFFKATLEKYDDVLQHLKSKRRKVTRKMKLIDFFNKASGVCITAACGLVAVTAFVLAAHTLTALIIGPAILSLPIKPLRKKIHSMRFLQCGVLRKVGEQLDVAAKGTYILNRDFDTMSRLVDRLHDEIEHNKAMIQFCLERGEDRFSMQVLKEMKKKDVLFKKQVEELEEHVYLCLLTINKARALVIKELSNATNSCTHDLE